MSDETGRYLADTRTAIAARSISIPRKAAGRLIHTKVSLGTGICVRVPRGSDCPAKGNLLVIQNYTTSPNGLCFNAAVYIVVLRSERLSLNHLVF